MRVGLHLLSIVWLSRPAVGDARSQFDSIHPGGITSNRALRARSDEEAEAVRGLYLLTAKPVTYAANVAEADLADMGATNAHVKALREKAAEEGREVVIVSAQVCGVCRGSSTSTIARHVRVSHVWVHNHPSKQACVCCCAVLCAVMCTNTGVTGITGTLS